MKKFKKRKLEYSHQRWGDTVKVEIKDQTRHVLYSNKFNINDKNAILSFLQVLENYSGFSVLEIINEKLKLGEWF